MSCAANTLALVNEDVSTHTLALVKEDTSNHSLALVKEDTSNHNLTVVKEDTSDRLHKDELEQQVAALIEWKRNARLQLENFQTACLLFKLCDVDKVNELLNA